MTKQTVNPRIRFDFLFVVLHLVHSYEALPIQGFTFVRKFSFSHSHFLNVTH